MKMGLWCCGLMAVAAPAAAQDSLIAAAKGLAQLAGLDIAGASLCALVIDLAA